MTQLNEKEMQLAALISEECATPADLTATLKNLFAGALEKMLEAEMDEHLGYAKNSVLGNNSGNSRNGYGKKTVKSEWGESGANGDGDFLHKKSLRYRKLGDIILVKRGGWKCREQQGK